MSRLSSRTAALLVVWMACAPVVLTGAAHADETALSKTSSEAKSEPTIRLIGKKLRRGAANAGLGWLEVPAGIQEIGSHHGVGAAATWGLVHGTGRAVQRTAVGLFEIVTFPFALTQNYEPIIQPEFVLDKPSAPESETPKAASPADDAQSQASR